MGERDVDQSHVFGVTRNTYTAHSKFSENTQAEKIEWSIERENLWKRGLLRIVKALVRRLGLCSKIKEKRLSQNAARKFLITNSKPLEQNKRSSNLQEESRRQQKDFLEVHQQNLTEMEELRKFQSSTFDTHARRKLIEDQNMIMEFSGRLQELQNEVNCMNDSEYFQDAESVRSGNSHVTSQPRLLPKQPILEGLLRPLFVSPRRKEGLPDSWDTPGISGNVFANPQASSTAPYPQELNHWNSSSEEPFLMSTADDKMRSRQIFGIHPVYQETFLHIDRLLHQLRILRN